MTYAPSTKERRAFGQLCDECARHESEIRQSANDPAYVERKFSSVWDAIARAKEWDARVALVEGHRALLAAEVRSMCERRWQVISRINA